jgi:hypothetical protein
MKLFLPSLFAIAVLAAPVIVRQATITDADILQFALTVCSPLNSTSPSLPSPQH